jgi:hypothetical protein
MSQPRPVKTSGLLLTHSGSPARPPGRSSRFSGATMVGASPSLQTASGSTSPEEPDMESAADVPSGVDPVVEVAESLFEVVEDPDGSALPSVWVVAWTPAASLASPRAHAGPAAAAIHP